MHCQYVRRNRFSYLFAECWTEVRDVHGPSGTTRNVETLTACQSVCISEVTCVAIDWDAYNPYGEKCWIHISAITGLLPAGGIIHYQLNRALCPS